MEKTDLKELIKSVEYELSDLKDLLEGAAETETLQRMIEAARQEAERLM